MSSSDGGEAVTYEWTAMKEGARAAGAGTGTGGDIDACASGTGASGAGSSSVSTMASTITTCHGKDHIKSGVESGSGVAEGGSINDPGSEGGDLPWPGYGRRAFDAADMQLEFLPYEGEEST